MAQSGCFRRSRGIISGVSPTRLSVLRRGPRTKSVSMSLLKTVQIKERYRIQFGAQTANLFNHPNYSPPNTTFNTSAFGTIIQPPVCRGCWPAHDSGHVPRFVLIPRIGGTVLLAARGTGPLIDSSAAIAAQTFS